MPFQTSRLDCAEWDLGPALSHCSPEDLNYTDMPSPLHVCTTVPVSVGPLMLVEHINSIRTIFVSMISHLKAGFMLYLFCLSHSAQDGF